MLSHLSLFSGIGGIDLAAELAGFDTVGQVEKDPFCLMVLNKYWPSVPKWTDVRDVTRDTVNERVVMPNEERPRTIDLISGGFPCQPYSIAGRRQGEKDDRDLWPEMLRVISEVRPTWVVGENVAHFVNVGLERTLFDLEAIGYETAPPLIIPACSVGAPHLRKRVFIIAHTKGEQGSSSVIGKTSKAKQGQFGGKGGTGPVPDPELGRCNSRFSNEQEHEICCEGQQAEKAEQQGRGLRGVSGQDGSVVSYPYQQRLEGYARDEANGRERKEQGGSGGDGGLSGHVADSESWHDLGMLGGGSGHMKMMNNLQDSGVLTEEEKKSMSCGWNGGLLNPTWVEWLMGFPIGWSDLKR